MYLPKRLVAATRIQIICPAGPPLLIRATNYIITWLLRNDRVKRWGGFTYSQPGPTAFTGYFWDEDAVHPEHGFWERDHSVLLLIDAPGGR
jgi:hypothetical protein